MRCEISKDTHRVLVEDRGAKVDDVVSTFVMCMKDVSFSEKQIKECFKNFVSKK